MANLNPTVFLVAIAAAAALVYVPFLAVGYERLRIGYNFSAPRTMFDQLPAYAKRATWAHQNGFESLTLFAPAALMAYITEQTSALAYLVVLLYLGARLLYPVFYILNLSILRSAMFAVASVSTFTLFGLSIGSTLGLL